MNQSLPKTKLRNSLTRAWKIDELHHMSSPVRFWWDSSEISGIPGTPSRIEWLTTCELQAPESTLLCRLSVELPDELLPFQVDYESKLHLKFKNWPRVCVVSLVFNEKSPLSEVHCPSSDRRLSQIWFRPELHPEVLLDGFITWNGTGIQLPKVRTF